MTPQEIRSLREGDEVQFSDNLGNERNGKLLSVRSDRKFAKVLDRDDKLWRVSLRSATLTPTGD